jgi:hypothetical protein
MTLTDIVTKKNGPHISAYCDTCNNWLKHIKQNPDMVLSSNKMGAIQTNSAKVFLSISDGKICRRVQSPTATSTQRTTKDGRIVHEELYSGWEGKITNIGTRDSDYGKEWQITIEDNDGTAILSMKYSSGYANSFLKALPNVDLSKNVKLTPKVNIEGDKKRTVLFINQDGKAIKWYFTKETPNGLPGLKKVKIKGVETWDDSDMMDFLEDMVKNKILPQITGFEHFTDDNVPF